jgi:hypothetical protein
MFFNDKTGEVMANPDPNGGLYIVDRKGGSVRYGLPALNLRMPVYYFFGVYRMGNAAGLPGDRYLVPRP